MSLKVLHVAHGIELEQTGAGYSIPAICWSNAQQGIRATLASLKLGGEIISRFSKADGLEIFRFPFIGPRKIGYSPQLKSFLQKMIPNTDIVQTHFLWSYPIALAARLALRFKKPFLMLTHGALFPAALAKNRLAKWAWLRIWDGPALEKASCVLATSEAEAQSILQQVHPRRIAVIPHGIHFPDLPDRDTAVQKVQNMTATNGKTHFLLYLGNLTSHKNVDKLIQAWSRIHQHWPAHVLILVGSGPSGFQERLFRTISELGLDNRVKILPPVFGDSKWTLLRAAEALVLPSRSENFGIVVAEGLYCGTPVVASQGYPWPILETEGFGRWVEPRVDCFAQAIHDVLQWPSEKRKSMARRSSEYIQNHFSWKSVGRQYLQLYQEILEKAL